MTLAKNVCYLPLDGEIIPCLKWGMLPLRRPDKPWMQLPSQPASALSETDYLDHMQREYERLNPAVRGLLTFDQFLQQAQSKRPQIEKALTQHKDRISAQQQQVANDWYYQHFYHDPESLAAWQQSDAGFQQIWLALDPDLLAHEITPLQYRNDAPARYCERLSSAPLSSAPLSSASSNNGGLQQSALVVPGSELTKQIQVQGTQMNLLTLPPKAVKGALLGMHCLPEQKEKFVQFWKSDMRYQRKPLSQMVWPKGDYQFSFEPL